MDSFTNQADHHLSGNLELLAKSVVEGFITGLHKSPFHGFSVEFAEHRAYNRGDNVRNIDWKLFGKTEKLYTKRYEEETNLRCQFVIDTSSSMFFPEGRHNKLSFAVEATAALIYLLKRQRDAFGLSLFSNNLWLNTPARSTTVHQQYLFNQLTQVLAQPQMNVTTDLHQSLHQVADAIHQRSMVIIFSDLLTNVQDHTQQAALFAALQHLKFNKHEVILFSVADQAREVDFQFENRPYQFIDLESGEKVKANAAALKESYLTAYRAYRQGIVDQAARYKINLIEADIAAGFHPILTAWLIKRQKMN